MAEPKHTLSDLHQMQSLPLSAKIRMTKQRIKWWVDEFGEDGVYISFSGGKDSTVLLHMARQEFSNLKAAYADTGLEFPEIKAFVKTYTNVDIIKPKMSFPKVVEKYGFPLISKEVSECVSGARKYLKAVEDEMNVNRSEQRCIYCGDLLGKKGCLGMCNKHYIQYKRWGDPLHADKKERATIDGYYRDGKTGRREHRVIWEEHYGEKLAKDEVIHHINFVKTDNRIENLYKYPNASEHVKAHRQYERLMDTLTDNEEIYFENGEYLKRERERVRSGRQTLESAHKWWYSRYRRLTGIGEYATDSSSRSSRRQDVTPEFQNPQKFGGGYANKLRRLSGTGAYSRGTEIESAQNFTSQRLRKVYSQLPSSKDDGNPSEGRNGDSGDYP